MYTIFGSSGFIGKELASYLKEKKQRVFTPRKNQIKFNNNLGYIIYCVGSDDWKKKTKKGYFSNLGHLKKILFNNKFKSIVFLSTTRLYINSKNNTKENSHFSVNTERKNDYYNILKIASEALLLRFNKKIKIVRLSNVFGFNHKSPLLLPTLIKNSLNKSKIEITISENSTKDYILIDDAINLIIKILKKGRQSIYNVASGKNIKIKEITKIIKKETNCKIILKNQKTVILEPKIDIMRIKKEFNFKNNFKLEKSLPELIKRYKKIFN